MTDIDDLLADEGIFGEIAKTESAPAKTSRKRRKGTTADLFLETKLRMVMRINRVSRAKALEIVAARAKKSEEGGKSGNRPGRPSDDDMMSAEEFFGG